jgi:polysaccharide pyruvyl transferase WcaK-like protein
MRIAFFGHFGTQNTGNESTLLAILSRLRVTFPDSDFCCVCSEPDVVVETYGIDAVPISGRGARLWDRRLPIGRRVATTLAATIEELVDYVRTFRRLRGTTMMIIPGTGLLTDAYGLFEWGPYNLFKWTLLAKARRSRVLFVSVGAGPLYGLPGRMLVRSTLSLADYRSYRDASSAAYLESIGFNADGDPIYPDLAFSLPEPAPWAPKSGATRRRVVGLGLMLYDGKLDAEAPVRDTYDDYLVALAVLVEWLLTRDYDVRLLLGDRDTPVIDQLRSLLRSRSGTYEEDRVIDEPIASVPQVLAQIGTCDVVVATRFHNVLLALLLNRPVVAISFHHKCASLMDQMGLSEYCQDIRSLSAERLIEQFEAVERDRETIKRAIRLHVEASRRALDEQYDRIFGGS